jgi:hypothetical protein
MVHIPLLIQFLSVLIDMLMPSPERRFSDPFTHPPTDACITVSSASLGLADDRSDNAFEEAFQRMEEGRRAARYLAVADMTLPSTSKRLFIIDMHEHCLVSHTWVAHGQGSGELMCDRFSNREGSHATSRGLYRIGPRIMSPKHGPSLLLHGLDKGRNCQAEAREVIMHGADYVSEAFIAAHGRLGRSWGCPAVAREEMERIIGLLADQGYLYVYGH